MATIVLSAVGTAVGSSVGGSVLGLSGAVLGRAAGATLGRMIDERLLGGSAPVEHGRVERFRVSSASEGVPVSEIYGRARIAGQVIWASRFLETSETSSSGGKGGGGTSVTEFSYSVSLALSLCTGVITRVGRIWADGREIAKKDINIKVYDGSESQLPVPKIEAVEGAGNAPSYRGVAYVVIEDLALGQFGNRVPQLSFEVVRPARPVAEDAPKDIADAIKGVALVPGTGEYALATTPVHFDLGLGAVRTANVNSPSGKSDFETSIEALGEEMPGATAASLVVSWFGDDLRASACQLKPKVEQNANDGSEMPWVVSSVARAAAEVLAQIDGRPVYGGTPADAAVVEAIQHMKAAGHHIMFYPFILMEQMVGNGLPDPWTGGLGQPEFPWRGRITTSLAPGQVGSPDQTAAAATEVDQFFGTCAVSDFSINGTAVTYSGPAEWSYRRFILHYAHLCAAAGGVDAFCIGSEMRGLTQIRDGATSFPAVAKLIALAADVRSVLGAGSKISYAADWSEYFGYHPQDGSGDVLFHLDPFWADANIDFVGIDNYFALSDWRDGDDHTDASWGSIYDLGYLQSNILGGKDYDWFYGSPEEEAAQIRAPISDGAHGEDWVFRAKDIPGWWGNDHFNRPGGVRDQSATAWVPGSKPIWFTEFGCAAVDKGTNEPNKFLDPKSSESSLPKYSTGRRDDLIQAEYLRAVTAFWDEDTNNPTSAVYGGPMIDMSKAHVWAWDTRPFPRFPNDTGLWSDGENYSRGHWISGRIGAQSLAGVVAHVCEAAGVADFDVSRLYGTVRGYAVTQGGTARAMLQPLMLAYAFDAIERDGTLIFRSRTGILDKALAKDTLAINAEQQGDVERIRAPEAEVAGRIRLNFAEAESDFSVRAAEVIFPDEAATAVDQSELPLVLTKSEARAIIERWLAESRVARDGLRISLPPSMDDLGAGDVVSLPDGEGTTRYRIDRTETAGLTQVEAVRVERSVYVPSVETEDPVLVAPHVPALPVFAQFLDLPLLKGDEVEHAPHLAVSATPWPGSAAVFSSASGDGFSLNTLVEHRAIVGTTLNALAGAAPDIVDRGAALQVQIEGGDLASNGLDDVLNGAGLAAVGDGTAGKWEVFQFTNAVLVGAQTWELSDRLRGQAGTDGIIPASWPPGSVVVFLDRAVGQIDLPASARGLERTYRIGPGDRSYDDASYTESVEAFDGIGLRPYAPAHLKAAAQISGDVAVTWVRRTRIDGDSWQSVEVPLGETSESYLLRVIQNSSVLREETLSGPQWTYSVSDQTTDGAAAPYDIEVAQQSDAWGPGLFRRITFNG